MRKMVFVLMIFFLLSGANLFAADGDLIVNGNVGIGTESPTQKLDIVGGNVVIDNGHDYMGRKTTGAAISLLRINGNDDTRINAPASHNIIFTFGGTEKMRLDSTGKLGIGTTTPDYKLQLSADSAAKPGSNTWTVASDIRLKTNIQPYTKGLREILQINPVSYQYNGSGEIGRSKVCLGDPCVEQDVVDTELLSKTYVGVIAQDVQAVVPETVTSHKGKINAADKDETDILDFDAHSLTFILINAVKELSAQIDSLNRQIADLKARAK
jgi:hypothetical protein